MDTYNKMFKLEGKSAILVGATGLIGSAFAEGLAEYGAKLVLADIDQGKCDALAGRLKQQYGADCFGIAVDISNKKSVEALLAATVSKYSNVDLLVNSAQNKTANFFMPFEDYPEEDWDKIIDVNLKGVFLTCQVIGSYMVKKGKGNIINLASTYAVVATNHRIYEGTKLGNPGAYSASKGGVIALSQYLAAYWAQKNVRVNMITPHGVYNNHEERFIKNFSELSPLKRMSKREEVVGAMLYLASDASSYVTGHNLIVDGGWTVW